MSELNQDALKAAVEMARSKEFPFITEAHLAKLIETYLAALPKQEPSGELGKAVRLLKRCLEQMALSESTLKNSIKAFLTPLTDPPKGAEG